MVLRRAAGEPTPGPAARRLGGPASRGAAARQLQRLVRRPAGLGTLNSSQKEPEKRCCPERTRGESAEPDPARVSFAAKLGDPDEEKDQTEEHRDEEQGRCGPATPAIELTRVEIDSQQTRERYPGAPGKHGTAARSLGIAVGLHSGENRQAGAKAGTSSAIAVACDEVGVGVSLWPPNGSGAQLRGPP
jgi:hypothetical protein